MIVEKQRVQLDLSPKMAELLDDLVNRTDAASRAEVIRRAISIYNLLLLETEKGKRVELSGPRHGDRERVLLVEGRA
jgi:metal-responsive CopG/Arc/MetJ family transcriptional regulator